MREHNIQSEIMIALSSAGTTIFRNNTAKAWVGQSHKITTPCRVQLNPGDVVVKNARVLHAGLCVGSSDLIGITPVKITADMVGQTIGVFTAAEVKTKTGRPTPEQINFIDKINSMGGLAGIVRSPDDALQLVRKK